MSELNIHEVLTHLPQRYPLLMIDRVLEFEPGKRIRALKNISANEPQFLGHFPGRPIMPAVLILEAMAQAACILALRSSGVTVEENRTYYYAGIDGARFKRPVEPGDQMELEVVLLARKRTIWKFSCVARVAGGVAAEAEILCTERLMEHK
jgi:3-hydroxyacyl-[acyl-carrier-protein] dehydratase